MSDAAHASRRRLIHCLLILIPSAIAGVALLALSEALYSAVGGNLDRLDIFWRLLVLDGPIATASLGTLALAALALPWLHRLPIRPVVAAVAERPVAVAAAAFVLLAGASLIVYQAHPLSMDEYAPVFQAQTFATGRLATRFDPVLLPRLIGPDVVDYFFTTSAETGRVVSGYWPGHALILAPFALMGVPWLLGPLAAAASLWLIHRLTATLTDDAHAPGWAILFAIGSAAFVVNGISFYSMTLHLMLGLVFVLLLSRREGARLTLAGGVGSLALTLHNPVPHLLFATPWALWIARRRGTGGLARLALGYLPLTVLFGLGWPILRQQLGGPAFGPAAPHTDSYSVLTSIFALPDAILLGIRAAEFTKLWVWAMPGLVVLATIGVARRWRHSPPVALLAASAMLTLLGYLFVALAQGHGWGSRYFHSAWMVLPVCGALAVTADGRSGRTWFSGLAGVLAIGGLLLVNGAALAQVGGFVDRHLDQLPESPAGERAIIFLDPDSGYYAQDLIQNDPLLRSRRTILRSFGTPADSTFMAERFPGFRPIRANARGSVWISSQ